jgi:hypothetical protein
VFRELSVAEPGSLLQRAALALGVVTVIVDATFAAEVRQRAFV